MASYKHLRDAQVNKENEFYTQLDDIEKECFNYKEHFCGKIIYCNCDNPYESNFVKYFIIHFNEFKLKKLIVTNYNHNDLNYMNLNLFDDIFDSNEKSYHLEITHVPDTLNSEYIDIDVLSSYDDNTLSTLKNNGDFRSRECRELLCQSDIVVTNPPFSLFREYISQLIKYDKKFLILGNQNMITYKEVFPLIKEDKIWLGYNHGEMRFSIPDYYKVRQRRYSENEYGQKIISIGNICWFTNIEIPRQYKTIDFLKSYDSDSYYRYDNYDAINIDELSDIPDNYYGVMGVPVTFLFKYCPDQFNILQFRKGNDGKDLRVNGVDKYFRVLVQRKHTNKSK